MAKLNEVFLSANRLFYDIKSIIKLSGYDRCDDLSELEMDDTDSDQIFLKDELRYIIEKLDDVRDSLEYLNRPIKYTAKLFKNGNGKYGSKKGDVFSCGRSIEVLVDDGYRDYPYWDRTRVEHDGHNYYIVGHSSLPMDGLTIRVRG